MHPRRRVETRGDWPKNILKLKERDKATFFSPTNEWSLPAPVTVKPEERELVADSDASMHILSRKDLNSAELETVRVSKNPTTVVTTARCKHKQRRRSRVLLPLDQWSKTTTHQKWQTDKMQHGEQRTDRCPWSVDLHFKLSFTCISDICTAGSRDSYTASRINKK